MDYREQISPRGAKVQFFDPVDKRWHTMRGIDHNREACVVPGYWTAALLADPEFKAYVESAQHGNRLTPIYQFKWGSNLRIEMHRKGEVESHPFTFAKDRFGVRYVPITELHRLASLHFDRVIKKAPDPVAPVYGPTTQGSITLTGTPERWYYVRAPSPIEHVLWYVARNKMDWIIASEWTAELSKHTGFNEFLKYIGFDEFCYSFEKAYVWVYESHRPHVRIPFTNKHPTQRALAYKKLLAHFADDYQDIKSGEPTHGEI